MHLRSRSNESSLLQLCQGNMKKVCSCFRYYFLIIVPSCHDFYSRKELLYGKRSFRIFWWFDYYCNSKTLWDCINKLFFLSATKIMTCQNQTFELKSVKENFQFWRERFLSSRNEEEKVTTFCLRVKILNKRSKKSRENTPPVNFSSPKSQQKFLFQKGKTGEFASI